MSMVETLLTDEASVPGGRQMIARNGLGRTWAAAGSQLAAAD
jgi:hypothetical protein